MEKRSKISTRGSRLGCIFITALCLFDSASYSEPTTPNWEGLWETGWLEEVPGYLHKFQREFIGSQMIARSIVLLTTPSRGLYSFEVEVRYTYVIGKLLRGPGDRQVYELDIVSDKVLVTPRTHSAAGLFWQRQECGLVNWKVNEPTDASGRVCETAGKNKKWPTQGQYKSYDIAEAGNKIMRFGDILSDHSLNGTTPLLRPTALIPNEYYQVKVTR
ncbi:MAG: hypothetical protein NTV34_15040 [Proteobacteria bacterium]|nr:hypothetical protein [Pseudomonadota bacterium]